MATTNSLTTTYAGEFAGKYVSAALLSGKTLAEGNITVKPNVKFKEVMKKDRRTMTQQEVKKLFTDLLHRQYLMG